MKKRLFKSKQNKQIFGVCGGIGRYFNVDATLIRIAWLLLILAGGVGAVAYIVAAIIMPQAEVGEEDYIYEDVGKAHLYRAKRGAKIFGVCQGISDAYGFDVTLVRVIVAIVCCFGIGILAYALAAIIIPINPEQ